MFMSHTRKIIFLIWSSQASLLLGSNFGRNFSRCLGNRWIDLGTTMTPYINHDLLAMIGFKLFFSWCVRERDKECLEGELDSENLINGECGEMIKFLEITTILDDNFYTNSSCSCSSIIESLKVPYIWMKFRKKAS